MKSQSEGLSVSLPTSLLCHKVCTHVGHAYVCAHTHTHTHTHSQRHCIATFARLGKRKLGLPAGFMKQAWTTEEHGAGCERTPLPPPRPARVLCCAPSVCEPSMDVSPLDPIQLKRRCVQLKVNLSAAKPMCLQRPPLHNYQGSLHCLC